MPSTAVPVGYPQTVVLVLEVSPCLSSHYTWWIHESIVRPYICRSYFIHKPYRDTWSSIFSIVTLQSWMGKWNQQRLISIATKGSLISTFNGLRGFLCTLVSIYYQSHWVKLSVLLSIITSIICIYVCSCEMSCLSSFHTWCTIIRHRQFV